MNERVERAIKAGNVDALRRALDGIEDISERNEKGFTPFLLAAQLCDDPEIGKVLLEKGDDINATDLDEACTPIIYAAWHKNANFLSFLLQNGADFRHKDNSGKDALKFASYWGDRKTLELLLEAGADPTVKEGNLWDCLTLATRGNNLETMETLLEHGLDLQQRDRSGFTLLHQAAWFGCTEALSFLIDKGLDVNAQDKNGWTPLLKALDNNSPECVKVLLAAGADVRLDTNDCLGCQGVGEKAKAEAALAVFEECLKEKYAGTRLYNEEELKAQEEKWSAFFGPDVDAKKKKKKIKGSLDGYYKDFFHAHGAEGDTTGEGKLEFVFPLDGLKAEVIYNTEENVPLSLTLSY